MQTFKLNELAMLLDRATGGRIDLMSAESNVPFYVNMLHDPALEICLKAMGADRPYSDDLSEAAIASLTASSEKFAQGKEA